MRTLRTNDDALVERIPEAEHQPIHVVDAGRGLQRCRQQQAVQGLKVVRERAVGVHRRTGQDLRVDDSLADTPVVIQHVPEVCDVEPDLSRVLVAAEAVEQILNDAQGVLEKGALVALQCSLDPGGFFLLLV